LISAPVMRNWFFFLLLLLLAAYPDCFSVGGTIIIIIIFGRYICFCACENDRPSDVTAADDHNDYLLHYNIILYATRSAPLPCMRLPD
jgi:hypothetical protein